MTTLIRKVTLPEIPVVCGHRVAFLRGYVPVQGEVVMSLEEDPSQNTTADGGGIVAAPSIGGGCPTVEDHRGAGGRRIEVVADLR